MSEKKSYIHCDVCDIDIIRIYWNNHLDSDEHRRNLFKELPNYIEKEDDYEEEKKDI
jgi:hypothetical protein